MPPGPIMVPLTAAWAEIEGDMSRSDRAGLLFLISRPVAASKSGRDISVAIPGAFGSLHSSTWLEAQIVSVILNVSPRSNMHGWVLSACPNSVAPLEWSEMITSDVAWLTGEAGVAVA